MVWQKSLLSIFHNFIQSQKMMGGGAKVLLSGRTYLKQRQTLKDTINRIYLVSWGFTIYAFQIYRKGKWSWPKSMAYMVFAFTITGLRVNDFFIVRSTSILPIVSLTYP